MNGAPGFRTNPHLSFAKVGHPSLLGVQLCWWSETHVSEARRGAPGLPVEGNGLASHECPIHGDETVMKWGIVFC
ncbi:hypothetical protein Terro_3315 [Terriglobus roseus DSM 18391]|uniref:Uncharacterized protein n=1 Tax=Terriglobus roseus (strain DSM 18391 / NRRL B-41598 / KBS 63) TaxID=926566 RepID=I3ZJW4_TERRK|nr:hypothetical protein Terro_3315 [Terriglobus roseus DSM 18391]